MVGTYSLSFLKSVEYGIDFIAAPKGGFLNGDNIKIQVHPVILKKLCFFFKKTLFLKLNQLSEIVGVDTNNAYKRFLIVYQLLSEKFSIRFAIRTMIDQIDVLDSVSQIYPSSIWQEREVYDMFGIFFKGNKDLRRILNDYGFEGYPLRKDFPIYGFTEKYFSISENTICQTKISLIQEFRFDQRFS